jgi:hypothetical protein
MQKKSIGAICALAAVVLAGTFALKPAWFYRIYNTVNPPDPANETEARRLYKYPPKNWYNDTIEYYKEGYATNWANERDDLPFSDEMKDGKNTFGYLIRDLDGDGVEELMIGMDDKPQTRFTEIYIWNFNMGARRIWFTGNGNYLYLCDNNIVRTDSWNGIEETQFMEYSSEDNAMRIVQVSPEPTPDKIELTPFKE